MNNSTTVNYKDNTITTPVRTLPIVKIGAHERAMYAYKLVSKGWINCGLVSDDEREFYALHYMAGAPYNGVLTDEKASAVAFMPYCLKDTNYMPLEFIQADAVLIRASIHFQGGQVVEAA